MNAYATLDVLKSAAVLDISGSGDDSRLLMLLENVSRQLDGYCDRRFFALSATRVFDGDGSAALRVPDLISVDPAGLRTDEDGDREFETAWSDSDYLAYPANADPTGGHDLAAPYTKLVADTEAGARSGFPRGMRRVSVSGQWGYWRRLRLASESLSARADAVQKTLTLSDGADVESGHTVLVDSEQMYATGRGKDGLRVERGVNGTTAAAHEANAAIRIYEYPSPISEAALIQAARLWKRRDSAFADWRGSAGSSHAFEGLDPDVRQLIAPYRRLAI